MRRLEPLSGATPGADVPPLNGARVFLSRLLHYGMAEIQADTMIDTDRNYWGVKNKLRRLDEWTERYCVHKGHAFTPFVGSGIQLNPSMSGFRLNAGEVMF